MKKNVSELILMINKLEYLKRIQKKNEELIQIDEIDNINDILFELADELADELEFVIEWIEKKIKFIFEHILKLNVDDFQSNFKGYTYKKIVIAFCILVNLEIRVSDYKDTDRIIKRIENNFINRTNITLNSWIKDKNTLENQVIKIIDNKNILELKKWQVLNKEVLAFL